MKTRRMRCLLVLVILLIMTWNVYFSFSYSRSKLIIQMNNLKSCVQARYASDTLLHKHLYACPTMLQKSLNSLTPFENQRNNQINACFGSYLSPMSYPKRCIIDEARIYNIIYCNETFDS